MNNLSLFLHAHLPFVKHPVTGSEKRNYQEVWFYEAIISVYLPLLNLISVIKKNKKPGFRVNINFSPTILEMMRQPYFKKGFDEYSSGYLKILSEEKTRTDSFSTFYNSYRDEMGSRYKKEIEERFEKVRNTAVNQYERVRFLLNFYKEDCGSDLIGKIKELVQNGNIEPVAQLATHPLTPHITDHRYIDFQCRTGLERIRTLLDIKPDHVWLPEEAYIPELSDILLVNGIKGTILEPVSVQDIYRPDMPRFFKDSRGMAYYIRDVVKTDLVWDRAKGYPSNGVYKEFYRDIGWDWKLKLIEPYLYDISEDQEFTPRHPLNIRYYRITDIKTPLSDKDIYNRNAAVRQVIKDAESFISDGWDKNIHVLAFDAELFGHWWHEGPEWIYQVIKNIQKNKDFRMWGLSEYRDQHYSEAPVINPVLSAWGQKGNFDDWCSKSTFDFQLKNQDILEKMDRIYEDRYHIDTDKNLFNQLLREILLLQSSDFPFLIYTKGSVKYAKKRIDKHYMRFSNIYDQIRLRDYSPDTLEKIFREDDIFNDLDLVSLYSESMKINNSPFILNY